MSDIFHCWTDYTPKDPEAVRRMALAQATWPRQGWVEVPVKDSDLPRLFHEEGKSLPYITDIFDFACNGRQGIMVYTNADIHCRSDCSKVIEEAAEHTNAGYCFRRDFPKLESEVPDEAYASGHDYCGSDLYFFWTEWWVKYRKQMPALIAGLESWDCVMRHLIDLTNPRKPTRLRDLIVHERHGSWWERRENRYRLRGQKYCLATAKAWLIAHGIDPRIHGIPR